MENYMCVNTDDMPISGAELAGRMRFLRRLPIETDYDEPLCVSLGHNAMIIRPLRDSVNYKGFHKMNGAYVRTPGRDAVEVVHEQRAGKGCSRDYYYFYHSPKKD